MAIGLAEIVGHHHAHLAVSGKKRFVYIPGQVQLVAHRIFFVYRRGYLEGRGCHHFHVGNVAIVEWGVVPGDGI